MNPPSPSSHWTAGLAPDRVEQLNDTCFCVSLDSSALAEALESELGEPGLFELLRQRCPYLFSTRPVFVAGDHVERMAEVVRAIESVVALPSYREEALGAAPSIARHDPRGPKGVFFGYDFHLAGDEPSLLEINTNAGGAMLNAVLARAQRACCVEVEPLVPGAGAASGFEAAMVAMFRNEWRLGAGERPLRRIAIVDEAPTEQYLYPEFLLFRQLFERSGIAAVIAAPAELTWRNGALWHEGKAVDLVYNRLTDFALQDEASADLREAYLNRGIVLTPHPQAHALYADKRNLALLTDDRRLREFGAPKAVRDILIANIPRTEVVDTADAERLWRERRHLFFKPRAGFGSRATYRGEKLTRRVWQEILAGGFVAQALIRPGERRIATDQTGAVLKFDLRNYVYGGQVQWVAARLYQGQTTNFRTPGGGFAPVYASPAP